VECEYHDVVGQCARRSPGEWWRERSDARCASGSGSRFNRAVHAVLEDFGNLGLAWRGIDKLRADEQSIIEGILRDEYQRILHVVAFNAAEGWARDVTRDIALKVVSTAHQQIRKVASITRDFIERATVRHFAEP